MKQGLALAALLLAGITTGRAMALHFEINIRENLIGAPANGRLFVVLARTNQPEPRLRLASTGTNRPQALALDVHDFKPGGALTLDERSYPGIATPSAGDYFVQAVLDSNADLRSADAPGNLFSDVRRVHLDSGSNCPTALELNHIVTPEALPPETGQCRFVRLQSPLLTRFHHRPIYLRAGVILPEGYDHQAERRYPLWVRIGGYGTRFSTITNLMAPGSHFQQTWNARRTPRFILLQLDGAGPFGDPYQINSDNNGPYGDALVRELIPEIEQRFRVITTPRARVLSGTSTGGWVALALQVFYPDSFNGAWASCPDPVDFRAFQLINIYEDANAFRSSRGEEIPSTRDRKGFVTLTMREEVGIENLLGRGNSYTTSGEQWGAWNAVFSPRGPDGLPRPIWDPQTGQIDHQVARAWERYDLRLVLERCRPEWGSKLRRKLRITAGEADEFYLNGAVHLLEAALSQEGQASKVRVAYGRGKGHGWSDLSLEQLLQEFQRAVERP